MALTDTVLLQVAFNAVRAGHKVVVRHSAGTTTGTVASITATQMVVGTTTILLANIQSLEATP